MKKPKQVNPTYMLPLYITVGDPKITIEQCTKIVLDLAKADKTLKATHVAVGRSVPV